MVTFTSSAATIMADIDLPWGPNFTFDSLYIMTYAIAVTGLYFAAEASPFIFNDDDVIGGTLTSFSAGSVNCSGYAVDAASAFDMVQPGNTLGLLQVLLSGDDTVIGSDYNDGGLFGSSGNDSINGKAGQDTLQGDDGIDTLRGGGGKDILGGGTANDRLLGGSGADRLYGGDGQDTLKGGSGRDMLAGGLGADVFRFTSAAWGGDTY